MKGKIFKVQKIKDKILIGNICAVVTLFAWDFTYIIGKFLLKELEPVQILIFRFVLVALLSALLNIKEYHKKSFKEESRFIIVGFLIFLYFILENSGLKLTNASNIGFILGTLPFFSSITAHFFTKDEKMEKSLIIGFLISMFGVAVISFSNGISVRIKGDMLMLGAVIIWSFYSLALKKYKFGYSIYYVTKKTFTYASVFLILYILAAGEKFPDFHNMTLGLFFGIAYLVIVASFLGFIFWGKAIKYIGIVKTSNYLFFSPINVIIFSYIFLGENIGIRQIFGGGFILLGSLMLKYKKKK